MIVASHIVCFVMSPMVHYPARRAIVYFIFGEENGCAIYTPASFITYMIYGTIIPVRGRYIHYQIVSQEESR